MILDLWAAGVGLRRQDGFCLAGVRCFPCLGRRREGSKGGSASFLGLRICRGERDTTGIPLF